MAQRTDGWRQIFSVPAVYRAVQRTIGSTRSRSLFVDEYLRPRTGDRLLDIGCGTGDLRGWLGDVDYTGYDPSADYVHAAQEQFGDRGRFLVGKVGDLQFEPSSFDVCVAKGVLHHLDDDAAHRLFAEAHRALAPGGRLVTMDPALDEGQSRVARFLAERDRGQNVRSLAGYRSLAEDTFSEVTAIVRHDLLRVPYTHAIVVCRK